MEKKKNKLVILLLLIIIVLVGIIFYMIGTKYVLKDKSTLDVKTEKVEKAKKKSTADDSKTGEKEKNEQKIEFNNNILGIDNDKSINTKSMKYTVGYCDGISCFRINSEDKHKVEMSIDWGELKNQVSWKNKYTVNGTPGVSDIYYIHFEKKVEDVISVCIGQCAGYFNKVVFLMEDGSLEYIDLNKSLNNFNHDPHTTIEYKDFSSHGNVSEVSGVVKLYNVSAFPKDAPVGGYDTIIAQKADGSFYDLSNLIG